MRILCVLGQHAYGDPARGEGYEHANFVPALRALGHEVEVFDSLDRSRFSGFAELNTALLAAVERLRPELVFCVLMHYEIWLETLDALRARAAVLNWGTDDSWKYAQFARFVAPHVDLYATTARSAVEAARGEGLANVLLTQWAASGAALAEPLPAASCRYPVSFVGAAYGNRRRWIAALEARGVAVECFGHGWPNGPVSTEALRRIARESAISLNFADSSLQWQGLRPVRGAQIKARTFEVPGAGGFLLTEAVAGVADYYRSGEEVEVFGSEAELTAKVEAYLGDPSRRDAVCRAGFERTRREHTYEKRFAPLITEALRRAGARAPLSAGATAPAHEAGWALRWLRCLLVVPASLLFGPRRGPRAARRLLFELSWRVAGRCTYTARGWPGRLFYRES